MQMLVAGLLIWCGVHLLPAFAPGTRRQLVGGLGENGYKALFGVCMIAAVLLMVFGWKRTEEVVLYTAPEWGGIVTLVTMLGTSVTFFAPYMANNLSRLLRHPQLTGVILFGAGHLAAVGNWRALVLFGGFTLWAVLEIVLINRREGPWTRPAPATRKDDFKLLLTGLGFFMIFMFTHEGLFGVSPLPA
jgi:uncharacterized membrane protein